MQSGSSSLPGAKVRDAPAVKMRSPGPTNPPIRTGAHDARRFLAPPHHGWGGGAICPLIPLSPSLTCLPFWKIWRRHPIRSLANPHQRRLAENTLPTLFCRGTSVWVYLPEFFTSKTFFIACRLVLFLMYSPNTKKQTRWPERLFVRTWLYLAVPGLVDIALINVLSRFRSPLECILPNAKRKQQPRWEPPFGASTLHWGICGIYHPFITFWGWPRYISQHSYINQHRALAYHISIWSDVAHQVCYGLCIVHCVWCIVHCGLWIVHV